MEESEKARSQKSLRIEPKTCLELSVLYFRLMMSEYLYHVGDVYMMFCIWFSQSEEGIHG